MNNITYAKNSEAKRLFPSYDINDITYHSDITTQ